MSTLSEMSVSELASMVKAYGDDYGHEGELHRRMPELGGWLAAAQWLVSEHSREYWETRGGFDPMAKLDADQPICGCASRLTDWYTHKLDKLINGES